MYSGGVRGQVSFYLGEMREWPIRAEMKIGWVYRRWNFRLVTVPPAEKKREVLCRYVPEAAVWDGSGFIGDKVGPGRR